VGRVGADPADAQGGTPAKSRDLVRPKGASVETTTMMLP
jgi:hypothetical protein